MCGRCVNFVCACHLHWNKRRTFCTVLFELLTNTLYISIYIYNIAICMYSPEDTLKALLRGSIGYLLKKSILSFAIGYSVLPLGSSVDTVQCLEALK